MREWERGSEEGHVSRLPSFLLFLLPQGDVFVVLTLLAKIGNQVRCGGGFYMEVEITFSDPAGNSWLWVVACHQPCQFYSRSQFFSFSQL